MVSQIISLGVVMFSAVVLSAPPPSLKDVHWFEMEPATNGGGKELAKTDFETADKEWIRFKDTYGKAYNSSMEELNRFLIFRENLELIIKHNEEYNKGNKSYYLGINERTDLTTREIISSNGFMQRQNRLYDCSSFLKPSNVEVPDEMDWRTKGYVTKVKNQGQCGSCWSFSTTGSLEGQLYKKTGKLIPLSEQQLIDCSGSYGNMGCQGGLMDPAFAYIKHAGGIMSETDYPYKARKGKCHDTDKSKFVGTVTGCKDITQGNESSLQVAVATVGPVSVAINAGDTFRHYRGGVYDEPSCHAAGLNHAVLVVGYGTKESDYWTVKNSWGSSWGQQGYILMSRNKKNQCGIASKASYPLV